MNHPMSSPFAYDDFELRLLKSAEVDEAPADLPAKVGAALGLAIPALTIAGSVAHAAAVSASAGGSGTTAVGGSLLWMVAAKGVAIGLFVGVATIGVGQAAVSLAKGGAATARHLPEGVPEAVYDSRGIDSKRGATQAPAWKRLSEGGGLGEPTRSEPEAAAVTSEGSVGLEATGQPHDASRSSGVVLLGAEVRGKSAAVDTSGNGDGAQPDSSTTTDASGGKAPLASVARFDLVAESDPVRVDSRAPLPEAAVAQLSPEAYRSLRAKTIAQCRMLLGRSDAATALAQLDEFRAKVGPKRFGIEETLLRIEALVDLGRRKEARREADVIERLLPNSAELRRARLLAGSRVVR